MIQKLLILTFLLQTEVFFQNSEINSYLFEFYLFYIDYYVQYY